MKKLSLGHLLLLCLFMAIAGAWLYVRFRAWRGKNDENFLFLIALGIGVAVAFLADHRRHPWRVVAVAVGCALAACIGGTLWIAALERQALAAEFDRSALDTDDHFVALEAYEAKYAKDNSAPPFTEVTRREHWTDAEWRQAEQRWNSRQADEREQIRAKWHTDYDRLAEIGHKGVRDAFFGPAYLMFYGIAVVLCGAIVIAVQRDEARKRARP